MMLLMSLYRNDLNTMNVQNNANISISIYAHTNSINNF